MSFATPQEDIDFCLAIEESVRPEEQELYLKCMNGIPLSQRVKSPRPLDCEGRDVRDGCLLTGVFIRCRPKEEGGGRCQVNRDGYRVLRWDYVCDQSPEIQAAHERASEGAEYGMDFHEFINSADGLSLMAENWWVSLPPERRLKLLRDAEREVQRHLISVRQEIELELEGGAE